MFRLRKVHLVEQ